MHNNWKALCGALTMSALLAMTGCGTNPPADAGETTESNTRDTGTTEITEASAAAEATEASDENPGNSQLLLGGECLDLGNDSSENAEVVIGPTDLEILDELPDILKNSDLPKMNHYSADTVAGVHYYDPAISGCLGIMSYNDGTADIFYNSSNNQMRLKFLRPSGIVFSFDVRGITKENVNASVFSGRDVLSDVKDFAEYYNSMYKNRQFTHNDYNFTEDSETYLNNINLIYARFGVLAAEAFDELGLSWEDFGIHFGDEYQKYDAHVSLSGTRDKAPLFIEKQTFTDGISDSTGKTWVETVREGIKQQTLYYAEAEWPYEDWFAYNEARSNNFIDGSDYVQIETRSHETGFEVYYQSSDNNTIDTLSSKDLFLYFHGDNNGISIEYSFKADYVETEEPGVIRPETAMGFGIYCKPEEIKDIFASEESLKAALNKGVNSLYGESKYMTTDEMIKDFMSRYKRYVGSIDDAIKTMGTCLADYGIEY